jgi:hypothetical protein
MLITVVLATQTRGESQQRGIAVAQGTVAAVGARKVIVWIARAISYLIYIYLIAVEIILFLGFFLLLFGANPGAGFTDFIYRNLDRAMEPFRGMFTPIQLGTTSGNVESVFDTSILFAMIIYGILAIALSALIGWLTHRMRYLEAAEMEADRLEAERAAAAAAAAVPTATTTTTTVTASTTTPVTAAAPAAGVTTTTTPTRTTATTPTTTTTTTPGASSVPAPPGSGGSAVPPPPPPR